MLNLRVVGCFREHFRAVICFPFICSVDPDSNKYSHFVISKHNLFVTFSDVWNDCRNFDGMSVVSFYSDGPDGFNAAYWAYKHFYYSTGLCRASEDR